MTARAAIRESIEAANRGLCGVRDPISHHLCDRQPGHPDPHASCAGFQWDSFLGDLPQQPDDRERDALAEDDER